MRLVTKKWRNDFKDNTNYEVHYDLFDDFDAIESSFAEQYGIRLRKELNKMDYGEFVSYISGLNADTALGHIVRIRSEKDYDKIKNFTPAERKIKNDWDKKHAKVMSEEEYEKAMKNIEKIFISMGKGGNR